jgi:hypothetical protein
LIKISELISSFEFKVFGNYRARSSKGSKIAMEDLPDEIKVKIWLLRNNGIRASSTVQVMISFGYN